MTCSLIDTRIVLRPMHADFAFLSVSWHLGTPIQNNLGEFFQMIDFVNPGVLGSLATFNNIFAKVIDASRDKNASAGAKEIGDSRSAQVRHIHTTHSSVSAPLRFVPSVAPTPV